MTTILDPERQFFVNAGEAFRSWSTNPENPNQTQLAEELGIDKVWIDLFISGRKRFEQGDLENLAVLYYRTGIELLSPTNFPDVIQETRSHTSSPILIKRAWSDEKLIEFLEKRGAQQLQTIADTSPRPTSVPPTRTLSMSEKEKREWETRWLRDDLKEWLTDNNYKTGYQLADELQIERPSWDNVMRARRTRDVTMYNTLYVATGLESAKRMSLQFVTPWTDSEWERFDKEKDQGMTEDEALPKEDTTSEAKALDKAQHPLALAASEALIQYCAAQGIYPISKLRSLLGIPLSSWKTISSGNGFSDTSWYAILFLETGREELDPRLVPPPRMVFNRAKNQADAYPRTMSEKTWTAWFNQQPEERRIRFLKLTQQPDAPTSPLHSASDELPTVTVPIIGNAIVEDSASSTIASSVLSLVEGFAALVSKKIVDQLSTAPVVAHANSNDHAQESTQSSYSLINQLVTQLSQEVLNSTPAVRNRTLKDLKPGLGELSAILRVVMTQADRLEEAIDMYNRNNRRG